VKNGSDADKRRNVGVLASRRRRFGLSSLLGKKHDYDQEPVPGVEFPVVRSSVSDACHEVLGREFGGSTDSGHVAFSRLSTVLRKNIEQLVDQAPDFVAYRYPSTDQPRPFRYGSSASSELCTPSDSFSDLNAMPVVSRPALHTEPSSVAGVHHKAIVRSPSESAIGSTSRPCLPVVEYLLPRYPASHEGFIVGSTIPRLKVRSPAPIQSEPCHIMLPPGEDNGGSIAAAGGSCTTTSVLSTVEIKCGVAIKQQQQNTEGSVSHATRSVPPVFLARDALYADVAISSGTFVQNAAVNAYPGREISLNQGVSPASRDSCNMPAYANPMFRKIAS
jgi:hypothetical protein